MQAPMLECIDFTPVWVPPLARFLAAIDEAGETAQFSPHARDEETLNRLASSPRLDIHCLLVEGGNVFGYGLLRGWDEGYTTPSLGIAIHPHARGVGLGNFMMSYLEMLAMRRGASHVRLRVLRANTAAISLYSTRGYEWSNDPIRDDLMIGMKALHTRHA
jgi:ribosomal protein S18 acetylase RimI-like enzyme